MNMIMKKRDFAVVSAIVMIGLGVQPAAAKVTAAICIAAQEKGMLVYEAAKKNKKLYPTDEDAKAVANAVFTRAVLAENIHKDEYRGTGRNIDDHNQAVELCRRAKAPATAEAAGLFAKIIVDTAPSPSAK